LVKAFVVTSIGIDFHITQILKSGIMLYGKVGDVMTFVISQKG
jgi:hypothetical protein